MLICLHVSSLHVVILNSSNSHFLFPLADVYQLDFVSRTALKFSVIRVYLSLVLIVPSYHHGMHKPCTYRTSVNINTPPGRMEIF